MWRAVKLAAIVALLSLVVAGVVAWSNGVRLYAVDSGSMSPTFNTGALVVDEPVRATTVLAVGDVITFHPTPGYTATHRIVAIGNDGITTRGDANPSSDLGLTQRSMVAGRVLFSIPYGGYVVMVFQRPVGIIALLVLILGLAAAREMGKGEASTKPVPSVGGDSP